MRTAILTAGLLIASTIIASSTGCSMCCPGNLQDYGGVGGKWQRSDPENGRVGSVLSDAGAIEASNSQANYEGALEGDIIDDVPVESTPNLDPADKSIIMLGEEW